MKSHAHKLHSAAVTAKAAKIAWPSFTSTATFVGTSPLHKVSVYYDATLGAAALKNAEDLLAQADSVCAQNDAFFGSKGGATNVIVFALGGATDGTGGADHMACDYVSGQNIEVCASFGNSARVVALYEAELSECSMNGNVCGESTGEALSRWCAMVVSNNALSDFVSAPTWAGDGMANWVDTVEDTDQDYDSIGCGMAFISWMLNMGYELSQVASTMVGLGNAGTLAELYTKLTGDAPTNAWPKFQAAVAALPDGITSDDPFGGQPTPAPPTPTPPPAPPVPPAPLPGPGPSQSFLVTVAAIAASVKH